MLSTVACVQKTVIWPDVAQICSAGLLVKPHCMCAKPWIYVVCLQARPHAPSPNLMVQSAHLAFALRPALTQMAPQPITQPLAS